MKDTKQRLKDLYREGGIKEVYRGIRDYLLLDLKIPLDLFYQTKSLSVAGETILIDIDSPESMWRTGGFGEMPVLEDFTERVDANTVVWDIGANIGVYSLLAGEKGALSYAFEPGYSAVSQLHTNIEINDSRKYVRPVPIGLSDMRGVYHLSAESKSGSRSLGKGYGDLVPVFRGDEIDITLPEVIKIDVEGHEKHVLDGLDGILNYPETVYVELHEGTKKIDLYRRLWSHGFDHSKEWNGREGETHIRFDRVEQ